MYTSARHTARNGDVPAPRAGASGSRIVSRSDQHGEVAHRVDAEAPRQPGARDDERRDRRSDDPREIEAAGVEGDRVEQVFLPHQLDLQRLSRGDVERADHPGERREREQSRHGDQAGPREPPHQGRFDEQQRLRDANDAELGVAVGEHAASQREQQHREVSHGAHEADHERVVRQLEREPPLRDVSHPRPDQ